MAHRKRESSREETPATVDPLRAERLKRIAKRRSSNENELVIVALAFSALFIACVLLGSTLGLPSIRQLPGVLFLCLVAPTVALFVFYKPVKSLVQALGESDPVSGEVHGDRAERLRRIAKRRNSSANEKVLLGFLLLAGIVTCLVLVSSLDVESPKALAGLIVASLAFPTIVLFVLYEPVKRLLRRNRRQY